MRSFQNPPTMLIQGIGFSRVPCHPRSERNSRVGSLTPSNKGDLATFIYFQRQTAGTEKRRLLDRLQGLITRQKMSLEA